jgi:micrococcal nuclease
MRRFILVICTLTTLAFALEPQGQLNGPYRMLEVSDGDTVALETIGKVRLIGVDTPEKFAGDKLERQSAETGLSKEEIQAMGKLASSFTERLLLGQAVWLELDVEERDRFGRTLAYLYLADPNGIWEYGGNTYTQVNLEIVKAGWAQPLTIAPNVRYADLYVTAARNARDQGLGFWENIPSVDSSQAKTVLIRCVLYNPDGRDDGNETVTLEVSETTNVEGWRVVDANGHAVYLTGVAQANQPFQVLFTGEAVWNNDGDTAKLFDSGNKLVDEFSYQGGGSEACR